MLTSELKIAVPVSSEAHRLSAISRLYARPGTAASRVKDVRHRLQVDFARGRTPVDRVIAASFEASPNDPSKKQGHIAVQPAAERELRSQQQSNHLDAGAEDADNEMYLHGPGLPQGLILPIGSLDII